jgi:hypothetical protein
VYRVMIGRDVQKCWFVRSVWVGWILYMLYIYRLVSVGGGRQILLLPLVGWARGWVPPPYSEILDRGKQEC